LGLPTYIIRTTKLTLLALSLLLASTYSIAADFLDQVDIFERDGIFYINISSEIQANEKYVRDVLTDYIHIYRLSDSIINSKVLAPTADNKAQVETTVLCCLPLFCKEVKRVEIVSILESGNLHTKIVPDKSDFSSGEATWEISPMGQTTHLSYRASLEPDFFVPPIIGTRMVIRNLREQFDSTFYRIQHIASINESREWSNDTNLFIPNHATVSNHAVPHQNLFKINATVTSHYALHSNSFIILRLSTS
jgi:hypothetical protein